MHPAIVSFLADLKILAEATSQKGKTKSREFTLFDVVHLVLSVPTKSQPIVRLVSIYSDDPQHGHGSQAMLRLTTLADLHQIVITLNAQPLGKHAMLPTKLQNWYRQFDFTLNDRYYDKREIDLSEGLEMIRIPN